MFEKTLEIFEVFPSARVSFPGAHFSQSDFTAKTSGKVKTTYQNQNVGV